MSTPFLLGVNYWPRRKAMYWWAHFDPGEVREELAMIRDLQLTHVRLFLLWESFQPAPDRISPTALADLRTVCDIAGELGLLVEPTFFTGHMSGPNWAPDWLLADAPAPPGARPIVSLARPVDAGRALRDVYADPVALAAERLQLTTVVGALADHPAVWAWNLGNEPDLFAIPATAEAGRRWTADMVATIRAADPRAPARRPVTVGVHTSSLVADVNLRVDHLAAETDLSVMHGYSIYSHLARRPLDPDFIPFLAAATAALAGRPVLFEEMGLCTYLRDARSGVVTTRAWGGKKHRQFYASDEDAAAWYAAVLPRLVRAGALGAFAWCFADYDPLLWDRPPCDFVVHERSFGLYRADGRPKPAALAIRDFARTRPTVRAPERTVTLGMSTDEYYRDGWAHLARLYAAFGTLD